MFVALGLAVAIFVLSVAGHLSVVSWGRRLLNYRSSLPIKLAVALLALFSHLAVATLFAFGFWLGTILELGSFADAPLMGWMDYFYFSLVNLTTLGLGDVYPTQHLRVIAGVEAVTGFILISCTAQLFWLSLHKGDTHE